jgi:hypothetical protein
VNGWHVFLHTFIATDVTLKVLLKAFLSEAYYMPSQGLTTFLSGELNSNTVR